MNASAHDVNGFTVPMMLMVSQCPWC